MQQEHDKNLSRLITTFNNEKNDDIEIRIGRYGIYAQLGKERVTINDNIAPSDISVNQIKKLLADKNAEPEKLGIDKTTGNSIELKKGRFGAYLKSGDKMKSLPPGISEN